MEDRTLLSGTPQLVLNINSMPLSSNPTDLVTIGSTTYFTADDGIHGRELWKTDGTAAGTVMVKDIYPGFNIYDGGSLSSNPSGLTAVNGELFFSANDGVHGSELWKSDGTTAGTVMVADINAGSSSSYPSNLTNVKGTLFFTANDGTHGTELWKSDGTTAGTIMVKDIDPGIYGSSPSDLISVNGTLFFTADDPSYSGSQLWKSDGTTAGTVMVADINPGQYPPINLTNVNGTLFFSGNDGTHGYELWKSDGTTAGTVMVRDIYPGGVSGLYGGYYPYSSYPSDLTNVNGTLFFAANDGTHGNELWKSDGTTAGTVLVADINPGSASSNPTNLTNINGALFFAANDGAHGTELWKSDGTAAGAVLVKDINPGSTASSPNYFINVNGTLFFAANDGTHGMELWKSDGTATGTIMVSDINPGSASSSPGNLVNANGTVMFAANDGTHGNELWKSDGTAAGPAMIRDIDPVDASSYPNGLTNVNGTLFFGADNGTHGRGTELWKSDGTAAGTVMVWDPGPHSGPNTGFVYDETNVNGKLLFAADHAVWASDGTGAGTVNLTASHRRFTVVGDLTNVNGTVFFEAFDPGGAFELWKSDGTVAGTSEVTPVGGSNYYQYSIGNPNLTNVNGTLFFTYSEFIHGDELWKSDGTQAGTVIVKDINPGTIGSDPGDLTNVNGTLYFSADDGTHGRELWKSDGTTAGTVLVKDIKPGSGGSYLGDFRNIDGTLYFEANDGTHGYELWKSDGTASGTVLVKDINPGSGNSYPRGFTSVNGAVFFAADDGTHGRELWKTDGTAAGTVMVADINPGSSSSCVALTGFTSANGTLYFPANDGTHGTELWQSDGTASGTVMVADINPGSSSSYPGYGWYQWTNVNGTLFFTANDGTHGYELWMLAPSTGLVADAGGPYTITEGQSLTLNASGSSDSDGDPLTYSWTINGHANAASGVQPTLSWTQLQALGIDDGPATFNIQVTVDDGHGDQLTSPTTTLTLSDALPTAAIAGPTDGYQGVQGQVRTFAISATDPSSADTAAGFTYTVAWGDGQTTTTPAGQSGGGVALSHVYAAAGSYTVSVTAIDQDGGASASVTTTAAILVAEQQGTGLAVGGTTGNDTFTFTPGSTAGTLVVKLGGTTLGTYTASGGVQIFGQGGTNKVVINGTSGNDAFTVNGLTVTLNAFTFVGTSIQGWTLNGLAGNNTLTDLGVIQGTPVTFVGGSGGTNTLYGPNTAATWNISKANGGSLSTTPTTATVTFSQVQDLVGETAMDVFKMAAAGTVQRIDGGGGGDWLDYSARTTGVTVDLTQGSATGVNGGTVGSISNIQNVRGGSGNDTLTGNGGNILVGGAGNDTLVDAYTGSGASGRSILIGGLGGDNLTAGAAGDILINGTTNYDTNNGALVALLAEWQSADTYQQRFDSLQGLNGSGTGSHLNGSYDLIWAKTVKDDATADTLTGGAAGTGLDWFFASYPGGTDTIHNFDAPGDEYLNNGN